MNDELKTLWTLNELDEQISTLRTRLERHPEQRNGLEQRVVAERARLEKHKASLAALQLKRRDIEREVETVTGQERKFQGQLPAVKKNEEYQALLHEIAGCKERRSALETDVLMKLEEEERLQGERSTIDKAIAAAESERAERLSAIDSEERGERVQLDALLARRDAALGRLAAAARQRYERVHTSRAGRAVVPIQKNACGGCYRALPPQVLQEARRGDRILVCEGCGRIVIWPPEP